MDITFTKDQEKAFKEALIFVDVSINRCPAHVFTIAGYAGTGKTTLIRYLIAELNLEENTIFLAYTGKAVQVLNRKGLDKVSTIHSFAYKLEKQTDVEEDGKIKTKLVFKRKTLDEINQEFFRPKLLVIDEVSMVNDKMMEELREYGIPIIALGDPMQLPPIFGGNSFLDDPNVILKDITRQGKDSPIINLSMRIRNGKRVRIGNYGTDVSVIEQHEIFDNPESLLRADQVLCGKNVTRHKLNRYMRKLLKLDLDNPLNHGEKIICLKNYWNTLLLEKTNAMWLGSEIRGKKDKSIDYILTNGTIGHAIFPNMGNKVIMNEDDTLTSSKEIRTYFEADFLQDLFEKEYNMDKEKYVNHLIKAHIEGSKPTQRFLPNVCLEQEALEEGSKYLSKKNANNKKIKLFNYGYAITTHLSQGSEWDKVIIFEEMLGNSEAHKKWLYTAVTRSVDKCILVKN